MKGKNNKNGDWYREREKKRPMKDNKKVMEYEKGEGLKVVEKMCSWKERGEECNERKGKENVKERR